MYYLHQHQFSQLALFTVQILSCLFMGKAMVQHLWLLYTVEGPYGAPCIINKYLDSPRPQSPFLFNHIPGTTASSQSHLVTVMHAGV